MQEPRDGDFVAYIEALQKESAARLAREHINIQDAATAGRAAKSSASAGHFFEEKPKPAVPAALEQTIERIFRADTDARLVKAFIAGLIGLFFLVAWLADGGPFVFLVAVALLVYALPRLLGALRAVARPSTNKGAVEEVFGRSGSKATGTKR